VVQGRSKDIPDFAVSQDATFDQLAVSAPLFLKLGQRGGVHDRTAGLKLVNMDVYQDRCLLTKTGRTAKCRSGKIRIRFDFHLCGAKAAARRGVCDRNCRSGMSAAPDYCCSIAPGLKV
jgi:hypothetical protein